MRAFVAGSLIGLTCGLIQLAWGNGSEVLSASKPVPKDQVHGDMVNITLLYFNYQATYSKAPSKLEDLQPFCAEEDQKTTYQRISDGSYVVIWNLTGRDGTEVMAFQAAPNDDGTRSVAFTDGGIKQVGAKEFDDLKAKIKAN